MLDLAWKRRFKFERLVREYLWSEGFEETRTPLLVKSPGLEPHIRPIELKSHAQAVFLPTSPEFAMKKLIAKGMTKIFQICPAFRDEPMSPDHHPEFTMLELYETNITLEALQNRIEKLFQHLARSLTGTLSLHFRGEKVDFSGPWQRSRVVDLFQEFAEIDLRTHQEAGALISVCERNGLHAELTESWNDLYFKLWLNLIEPKLPKNRPIFVTHYPLSQSSLCNPIKDERGFAWANRFEVYVGNFELGNAFDELRDSKKQRANFEHDQDVRRETYGDRYPTSPIDEEFLSAIEKMPPTCGIALGLDRMALVILEASTLEEVLPLKSYWG
jgi:lysyl-tRNA synthetase class 2